MSFIVTTHTNGKASNDNIIEIKSITKKYGRMTALHEMDLTIRKGEFLSLLGPSGCGKTTLLRIIAGFHETSTGDIYIDGVSMKGVPPNKRPVNTVFQNYALFPHMTIAENIAFGPKRQKISAAEIKDRVEESLEMVGMEGFGDRFPKSLSGGQQQRIALARAIINRPRVLLLDEPLGALDLKLRKRMQFELKRLHDQLGITFIYVTHDQEEALSMSDRIAVMNAGRIVQLGCGETIYQEPNSAYVADFIGEANLIEGSCNTTGQFMLLNNQVVCPCSTSHKGKAKLMIRPENIFFDDDDRREGDIVIDAKVLQKVYQGHWWRVTVELKDGQQIVVCRPERTSRSLPSEGDEVTIRWVNASSRVLTS